MPSSPVQPCGHLVVISGPSGTGKSTIVDALIADCPVPLWKSISATTRKPRRGEVEGDDYFFMSPAQFAEQQAAGAFLESKEYAGNLYGTLQSQVSAGLAAGKWVLLEIDVQGTLAVLDKHPETLTIFIDCESVVELERRLRARNTETEAALQQRLETARRELAFKDRYSYRVINRDVPKAVREVCEILLRHAKEPQC